MSRRRVCLRLLCAFRLSKLLTYTTLHRPPPSTRLGSDGGSCLSLQDDALLYPGREIEHILALTQQYQTIEPRTYPPRQGGDEP